MNYGFEYENGRLTLYFHCMKLGKKLDVIAKNNNVSFEMDCDREYILYEPEYALHPELPEYYRFWENKCCH